MTTFFRSDRLLHRNPRKHPTFWPVKDRRKDRRAFFSSFLSFLTGLQKAQIPAHGEDVRLILSDDAVEDSASSGAAGCGRHACPPPSGCHDAVSYTLHSKGRG